jgi:hypothetical protein
MALCGTHHRRVHEGYLIITGASQREARFLHPDGTPYGRKPARIRPWSETSVAAQATSALRTMGIEKAEAERLVGQATPGGHASEAPTDGDESRVSDSRDEASELRELIVAALRLRQAPEEASTRAASEDEPDIERLVLAGLRGVGLGLREAEHWMRATTPRGRPASAEAWVSAALKARNRARTSRVREDKKTDRVGPDTARETRHLYGGLLSSGDGASMLSDTRASNWRFS